MLTKSQTTWLGKWNSDLTHVDKQIPGNHSCTGIHCTYFPNEFLTWNEVLDLLCYRFC